MAIFNTKKSETKQAVKDTTKAPKDTVVAQARPVTSSGDRSRISVLVRPRITEKGANLSENNAYAFDVSVRANKRLVSEAIRDLYKVSPVKVRVVQVPSKRRFVRGHAGVKTGGKKAYVFLKKGDKIEVI